MRKWIDIISEAPISDVEMIGDMTTSGSFKEDDLKAFSNPKWKANLVKRFDKTPHPINLYFMNFRDGEMSNQNSFSERPVDVRISPSTNDILNWGHHVSGFYEPIDFSRNFGFLPNDYGNRINMVMTHNYGDERFPLTPWMVAHRMIHAFVSELPHFSRHRAPAEFQDYWDKMRAAVQKVLYDTDLWKQDIKKIYAQVAKFRSAREGGIARPGEFYIELATQFSLTGDFTFDLSMLSLPPKIRDDAESLVTDAKDCLRAGITKTVGCLVVL